MTFNQYLIRICGQNWQGVHMDLVVEGLSEGEINDMHEAYVNEFEAYMHKNDLEIIPE